MNIKQISGLVLIAVAVVILIFSYNAYITVYHKTISTSNFTFLFSGIFWDLIGIFISAILIAIGLILAYPKGARWLANRNSGRRW
jgi:di/tricarboxylate transporter